MLNEKFAYLPSSWESPSHDTADLVRIFNGCFKEKHRTILEGGREEPLYQPSNDIESCNLIYFTLDYFSSALHEVAHWCIAGEGRRHLIDYGYWYLPDGRDDGQQAAFEQVEVKPQALELAFSIACKKSFRVSVDNLTGNFTDGGSFAKEVAKQFYCYCELGFPERADVFLRALQKHYNSKYPLIF